MNIDKWDLFSICESILLVSDKPVTVEQVVEVLLREQEDELDRLEDEADAMAKETFASHAAMANDPAFSTALRSPMVAAKLEKVDAEEEVNLHAWAVLLAEPFVAASVIEVVEVATSEVSVAEVLEERAEEPVEDVDQIDLPLVASVEEQLSEKEKAAKRAAADEARRQAIVKRELGKLVQDAFDAVVSAYSDESRTVGRGFLVVAVAGAYQLRTNPLCAPFIRHHLHVKPTKLSRAQLETLAIVAYRQPVTRPELEQIRGVDCGAAMKILLDKRLVRILGKKEEVGRPLLYGTSKEFLEFFKLGTLLELPTLREFQELTDEHKRQVEEELEAEAPLGNLRELADSTTAFEHDDSALIADLDSALNGAKQTANRVAELTGLSVAPAQGQSEDEPPTEPQSP